MASKMETSLSFLDVFDAFKAEVFGSFKNILHYLKEKQLYVGKLESDSLSNLKKVQNSNNAMLATNKAVCFSMKVLSVLKHWSFQMS